VLAAEEFPDATALRRALKTLLSGNREQWARFDELFDNYWFGRGLRVVAPAQAEAGVRNRGPRPDIWDKVLPREESASAMPRAEQSQGSGEGPDGRGTGRLIASRGDALTRTDLRTLVTPDETAEAERIAERLARAIRYRLSRRRIPARRGETIDLRRTIRRNLSRRCEPIELRRKHRPERPVKLVVLLDASGSMEVYSRYFINFVRGLIGRWLHADAFCFRPGSCTSQMLCVNETRASA
jgi:uncharacterized protein with von Willebrand factor type A (vWA) domain